MKTDGGRVAVWRAWSARAGDLAPRAMARLVNRRPTTPPPDTQRALTAPGRRVKQLLYENAAAPHPRPERRRGRS
ncbi:MAG TPA: hypothetical protein VFW33_02670 [Gemmataceae bacterium]|nr:hypothetical protein [Gemmataceae bacterium]